MSTKGKTLKTKGKLKSRTPDVGEIFGYWTVIDNELHEINPRTYGITCKCKCGEQRLVRVAALLSGRSKGCPCRAHDKLRETLIYVGDISDTLFSRIVKCAKARNIEFLISKEFLWELFLRQGKLCALTGLEITIEKSLNRKSGCSNITASLDRIDSCGSYTEVNVQWVHKDINKMKQDLNQDRFIQLCKSVTEHKRL